MLCLGIILVLVAGLQESNLDVQAQTDPANQVIQLVNQLRVSYGQTPYQVDPILMSVAQTHASWSAANNISSHLGPDGKNPDERAKAAGYGAGYNAFVIENVGSGTLGLNTPELVVSMWQGDYGHLNAMISPDYEDIGVGYAEGFGMSWFVMDVGWIDEGAIASATAVPQPTLDNNPANTGNTYGFVVSTPGENGVIYHEVREGQAAWTIAVYYDISVDELLKLNNLNENSLIFPGDMLLIRPSATLTNMPEPSPVPVTPTPTSMVAQQGLEQAGNDVSTSQGEQPMSAGEGGKSTQYNVPVLITLMLGIITIFLAFILVFTRPRWR